MFKDRRVSSWEDAQTSVPTGRKIVHLYWVRMPDTDEIILMGVGAAKKALGLTEAKLYSIAKAEAAAQRYWKDVWDRQANKPYYGSAREAKRAWIIANSRSPYFGSDIESIHVFDKLMASAVLMHRDGRWLFTTDQERVYELGMRGWEIVGPTAEPQVESNPPDDRERYSEPYSLLEPGHAEQIALELQEEDPDWSYRVQHDPKGTGLSFIEIFDEEGEFVGRWNHA
jgi:hypothetical protein